MRGLLVRCGRVGAMVFARVSGGDSQAALGSSRWTLFLVGFVGRRFPRAAPTLDASTGPGLR